MFGVVQGNATRLPFPDRTFGLVVGSPPYQMARTYGQVGIARKCPQWVAWMLEVTREALRVSKGLVLWVVAGAVKNHAYQPGPEGLAWEWYKQGGTLFRPAYWHRVGIPGSGGKQGLRADVEYILGFKRPGPLPWSNNIAMGHAPKWAPGGAMSYRVSDGTRVNEKPRGNRGHNGKIYSKPYKPPTIANPGNMIHTNAGKNHIGNPIAHENEAPFPESLVEFLIRTYCNPEDMILDPFTGSGTSCAVARDWGRSAIGLDLRESQCLLTRRRVSVSRALFHNLVEGRDTLPDKVLQFGTLSEDPR